jgi:hypothetical protein
METEGTARKSIHAPFVRRMQRISIEKEEGKTRAKEAQNAIHEDDLDNIIRRWFGKPLKKHISFIVLFYEKRKTDSDQLHDQLEKQVSLLGIRRKPDEKAKWSKKTAKKRGGRKKIKAPAKKTKKRR